MERRILLVNPNASRRTTAMMVEIARGCVPAHWAVEGVTAGTGVEMIVDEAALSAAIDDVERAWRPAGQGWDGAVVAAFGDPGLDRLRALARVPVEGICEASLLQAAEGGRRFGIATVTPGLARLLAERVQALGLAEAYTGIQLTPGDPVCLAARPEALEAELALAVQRCIADDGAQAVVIGGGPLGMAAAALQDRWRVPVIAPIPAAMARLRARLAHAT